MKFAFQSVKAAPAYNDKAREWTSWIWQMQNRLSARNQFEALFTLSAPEISGFREAKDKFKISSTPYYASLAAQYDGPGVNPIRRIVMPHAMEGTSGAQQMSDPLDEAAHTPVSRIIHRYSDRVLFLVTDLCSVYCRFCTRKRFTGHDQGLIDSQEYREALQYITSHPGVREVILSGGDPLTLSNKVLDRILEDLRRIGHIEILRVGSRMPVVCPMRVDEELCRVLKKHKPVYLMTHFSHPKELTAEAALSLEMLADHGIPIFNQMVLLNGVNNHVNVIQALSRRLLYLRVKPYYMFQCDPSQGTDHLRTTVESSEHIVKELWGHLSGLAMPTLSLDIPGGGGKTTLVPNFMVSKNNGTREFEGWDRKRGVYVDPQVEVLMPGDARDYEKEWDLLKKAKLAPAGQI